MKNDVSSVIDDFKMNRHDTTVTRLMALPSFLLRERVIDEILDAIEDIIEHQREKNGYEFHDEGGKIKWKTSETLSNSTPSQDDVRLRAHERSAAAEITTLSQDDVRLRAHERSAAEEKISGHADAIQNRPLGLFPYCGGPKGFERGHVPVVTIVDSTFTRERCCGIIGKGSGYGMFDRFCIKKHCTVKAHGAVKFRPYTQCYYAPSSNDSAYCGFFVHGLAAHRSMQTMQMNSQKWIEKMESMLPDVRGSILSASQLVSHPANSLLLTMMIETSSARTIDAILKYIHDKKRRGSVKRTLVVTKSQEETATLVSDLHLYKLSHYVKHKQGVVGLVSVCDYRDVWRAEDRYEAVIVSSVSSLRRRVEADLRNGRRANLDMLCKVLNANNVDAVKRLLKIEVVFK